MVEPFKNLLNGEGVARAASHLRRAWPRFDAARFETLATQGLDRLEMKARSMQIAAALEATLPEDFDRAAGILESALASPLVEDDLAPMHLARDGLAGWMLWPAGEWVARRGMQQPERALQSLHALTQRFTAEFAIRPFVVAHPALVFATLQRWTTDPSAHVRRLVSEGSRPRLPWGLQLRSLIADPSPTLPLLQALQDDPSAYVRRSVANHLNDIAKDHPGLIADWLAAHLPEAPASRRALLRHASRTLIKKGDRRVLAAWGLGAALKGSAQLALSPATLTIGQVVVLDVRLDSDCSKAQSLLIDYAVQHVKADGRLSPKVFKGWQVELGPKQSQTLVKRHSMREVTTRRYHAGEHRVDLLVNGRVAASASFVLRAGD